MKRFFDLHLIPPKNNRMQLANLVDKAAELGYHHVGISLAPNIEQKEKQYLLRLCHERGLDLVTRVDIVSRRPRKLLSLLKKNRRKFEIISVRCLSKSVSRQAAKDRRVDLLSYSCLDVKNRFFNKAEAELASTSLSALEIDVAPILMLEPYRRTRLISILRKEIKMADRFKVPIILSSGASEMYLLRQPKDYIAFAHLFGLSPEKATGAITASPSLIVERNRNKLHDTYLGSGIRIVKRGSNYA